MRALGVTLALGFLIGAFAGCLDAASNTLENEAPTLPAYATPETPHIDVVKFLAAHADFVTNYPIRRMNLPGHLGARDALEKEFSSMGLEVWRQKFTNNSTRGNLDQENICGIKLGSHAPDWWVVVGGHYDTVTSQGGDDRSQGAYDDGSGTWITVELARAFANVDTYYSIVFCGFDGEERGTQGSRAVFEAMHDLHTDLTKVYDPFPYPISGTRAMLDIDMFGLCYPIRAPIVFTDNDDVIFEKVDELRKKMGIPDDMFARRGIAQGSSDFTHWLNAEKNYDQPHQPTAFFISDFDALGVPTPVEQGVTPKLETPNLSPNGGRNAAALSYPFWHQVDTIDTMTAMAGSQDMLEAGFQTALDLASGTLSLMALQPDVQFEADEQTA